MRISEAIMNIGYYQKRVDVLERALAMPDFKKEEQAILRDMLTAHQNAIGRWDKKIKRANKKAK